MPAIRIQIGGQSFDAPLPAAAVSIGAAEGVDLRLQAAGVAAAHCVLEPLIDGRHVLKDSGSGYGTKVNGYTVKQVSLGEGDVIEVGDVRITYFAAAQGAAASPAAEPEPVPAAMIPSVDAPVSAPPPPPPPPPPRETATTPAAPRGERPAPTAPGDARPRRAKGKLPILGLLVGVAALAVILIAVAGSGGGDESLEAKYAEAMRRYDAKDYEGARARFQQIADEAGAGRLRGKAEDGLELVGEVGREIETQLERLWGERLDMTGAALAGARRRFLESYGDLQAEAFDALQGRILAAQSQWKAQNVATTQAEADALAGRSEFAVAAAAWKRLETAAPTAIDVSAEVGAARAALEQAADARADAYVAEAAAWNEAGLAHRSVKLFGDLLPRFEGFAARSKLEAGRAAAELAASQPTPVTPSTPGPIVERPQPPTPIAPPPPPSDDSEQKALDARAAAVLAKVQEEVDARRFREAAAALREAAPGFPLGAIRTKFEARAADHDLAATGLEALIAYIKANPDRYRGLKLSDRLTVSLTDADETYLHAAVTGGTSKHAWSRLPASAFPKLTTRMKPGKESGLAVSGLLLATGHREAAERGLFRAVQDGVAEAEAFAVLARWRGEAVPDGGYVVYDEHYVTTAEREFLVREAKIAEALAQLASKDAAVRTAACETLQSIGEPAQQRFVEALTRRRAFLVDELVHSKSFASSKYKTKLLQLLDERRKFALALIYDAQAYPYPNPQKKSQHEVEERVDQVREVWERPFDLVAQWDEALKERLAGVTETDEWLARADPGYKPDLEEIKARINKAIDVPSSADPSIREYSLGVLAYNTKVATTSTLEEKANVRSVNDYRMMMGLAAVKIEERLVRAARGHSRHMAQNQYFAHDVPAPYATPENRSPGARAARQGFGSGVGENIARGPSTGHGAFLAWFGSSGHHRNMLGRAWLVMGCGRASGTWWTQNFGGGSKSLTPPDPLPAPDKPFAPDPEDESGRPVPPGKSEVPEDAPPGDDGGGGGGGDEPKPDR